MIKRSLIILFVLLIAAAQAHSWNVKIPLSSSQDYHVVVKGMYPSANEAKNIQGLIQTTLKDIPGDAVVKSDLFASLPKGQWVVASLFDTKERAQWWIKFSTRNPKVPKANIYQSKLLAPSVGNLPYFPDAAIANSKFISEAEAIALVKQTPDVCCINKKVWTLRVFDHRLSTEWRFTL